MSSDTKMLIDKVPTVSPRPVPMKVLAFGMSRTGTMSMQHALRKLGIKSYHMTEAGATKSFNYWYEALRAKYAGEGRPYGRAEFDKLLGEYGGITDMPCILFTDELLAAYPDAQVILTERDIESWMVSMNKTVLELLTWRSFDYLAPLEPKLVGPFWNTYKYILSIWMGGSLSDHDRLRRTYREHYQHIRKVVPPHKLLEFKPGFGYEELCGFLDEPVPKGEEPYPHINQPDNIITMFKKLWWLTVLNAVVRVGGTVGAVTAGVAAVWYYRLRN